MLAVFATPGACSQKFERGTIRRMFSAGPLLGYIIACPGCRFTGSHLHDDAVFAEGPIVQSSALLNGKEVRWYHPRWVTAANRMRCYGCAKFISLTAGVLEVGP